MTKKPTMCFKQHELHADRIEAIQEEINALLHRYKDRLSVMNDRFDTADLMVLAGVMGQLSIATYTVYTYIDDNAIYSGYNDKTFGKISRKHLGKLKTMRSKVIRWQDDLKLAISVHHEENEREGTTFYADTHRLLRRFKMTIQSEIRYIHGHTRDRSAQ